MAKQGAETNVAPAGNTAQTSTSSRSTASTTAQNDSVQTDSKRSSQSGNGPMEDQPLVIDVSNLYDEDGLEISPCSGKYSYQVVVGKLLMARRHNPLRRDRTTSVVHCVVIQYVDGEGTLEVIETAPTGGVQNANDLPKGLPIISGSPVEDNTIKIDVSGISDEDGVGQFSYVWSDPRMPLGGLHTRRIHPTPALLRLNQSRGDSRIV